MANLDGGKARGCPSEKHVDRYRWTAVLPEALAQPSTENTKGTHVTGGLSAHGAGECRFGHARGEIAKKSMVFLLRRAVDDIVLWLQRRQHWCDLADRMLQIVVHCKDDLVLCRHDAAEQRIVLTVISAHPNTAHPV